MAPVRLTVSPSRMFAVVAEQHDADVVLFQVQRHALGAVRELHHLAGLHLVEAVDAGDAVADRQYGADFGDFRLGTEGRDLLFQNGGDFRGPDFHHPIPLMAKLNRSSFVFSELSTMREPTLTTRPPSRARIGPRRQHDLGADSLLERAGDRRRLAVRQRLRRGHLGGGLAALVGQPLSQMQQ